MGMVQLLPEPPHGLLRLTSEGRSGEEYQKKREPTNKPEQDIWIKLTRNVAFVVKSVLSLQVLTPALWQLQL